VFAEGRQIGTVTSVAKTADGNFFGLAFLRCRAGGVQVLTHLHERLSRVVGRVSRRPLCTQVQLEDLLVEVAGAAARVTELPFLHRKFSSAEAAAQAAASPPSSSQVMPLEG
jgi:hypothetical protein